MRGLALFLAAALLFGGCGYNLPGRSANLPEGIETLHVELLKNRTPEPFLENGLTDSVVSEFIRGRSLELAGSPEKADAILSGVITGYSSDPISYDRNDNITEYRSRLTAGFTLKRIGDGKVLWKGQFSWEEEYPASDDKAVQEDNEAAAVRIIDDRLAEEVYYNLVDGF